jgi:parallel beta-helix repeat protein
MADTLKYKISTDGSTIYVKDTSDVIKHSSVNAYAEINWAINNLTLNRTSKERILIEAGTYLLTSYIYMKNYTTLELVTDYDGDNYSGAILKRSGSSNFSMVQADTTNGVHDIRITGGRWDGNQYTNYSRIALGADEDKPYGNTDDTGNYSVRGNMILFWPCYNVQIDHCVMYNNYCSYTPYGSAGLYLVECHGSTIDSNSIYDMGYHGIILANTVYNVNVTNNIVDGCNKHPIPLDTDYTVLYPGGGIYFYSTVASSIIHDNNVIGNVVIACGADGISLYPNTATAENKYFIVDRNTIIDTPWNGMNAALAIMSGGAGGAEGAGGIGHAHHNNITNNIVRTSGQTILNGKYVNLTGHYGRNGGSGEFCNVRGHGNLIKNNYFINSSLNAIISGSGTHSSGSETYSGLFLAETVNFNIFDSNILINDSSLTPPGVPDNSKLMSILDSYNIIRSNQFQVASPRKSTQGLELSVTGSTNTVNNNTFYPTYTSGVDYSYIAGTVTNGNGLATAAPLGKPAPPTLYPINDIAIRSSPASLTLNWTMNYDGGSSVTAYKVYRSTSSGGETLLATLEDVLTYEDSGQDSAITKDTTYYYKVSATNSQGESILSAEANATATGDSSGSVPGVPTNLVAVAGNAQVSLTWVAPSSDGGSVITGYHLYRGTTSGAETDLITLGNVLSYTNNTNVTNGITYYYKVAAINSVGEGIKSNEASATPYANTVPSAPLNLQAVGGNGEIRLNWIAPTDNGGHAITGYKIYRYMVTPSYALIATIGNFLTYLNISLTNGQSYHYKVSAVNSVGEGPQSNETYATPATIPDAPNLISVVGSSSGTAQVVLTWSFTGNNGGSILNGYKIYRSTSSGGETLLTTVGPTPLTYTDFAVSIGQRYYYVVTAVNTDPAIPTTGEGPPSGELSAIPYGTATAPSAPRNLAAISGDGQIILTWDTPSTNGGSIITGYNVYRSTTSGNEVLITPTPLGVVTTYTNTGRTNGQIYFYEVTAKNSIGESVRSNETSAIPAPGSTISYANVVFIVTGNGTTYTTTRVSNGATVYTGNSAIAAINTYAINNLTSGRTAKEAVLLKGTFTITGSIVIPSYTILALDGTVTLAANTEVGMVNATGTSSIPVIHIEIRGGIWDGNKNGPQMNQTTLAAALAAAKVSGHYIHSGIRCTYCADFIIEGCEVTNELLEPIKIVNSNYGTISNNFIHDSTYNGIGVYEACSYIEIFDNVIRDVGDLPTSTGGGIYVLPSSASQVIRFIKIYDNSLIRCVADGVGLDTLYLSATCKQCLVDRNTFMDTSYNGTDAAISVGHIAGDGGGVPGQGMVGYSDYNIISNNIVYESGATIPNSVSGGTCYFVAIRGKYNVVKYNILRNSSRSTIWMYLSANNNVIDSNRVYNDSWFTPKSTSYLLSMDTTSYNVIRNNTFTDPTNHSIINTTGGTSNIFTMNDIIHSVNSGVGITIASSTTNTIMNNLFTNCSTSISGLATQYTASNNPTTGSKPAYDYRIISNYNVYDWLGALVYTGADMGTSLSWALGTTGHDYKVTYVPAGTYIVTSSVTSFVNGVTLMGAGKDSTIFDFRWTRPAVSRTGLNLTTFFGFHPTDKNHLTFKNFGITRDGSIVFDTTMTAQNSLNNRVMDVDIRNTTNVQLSSFGSFVANGTSNTVPCVAQGYEFKRCAAYMVGGNGFDLWSREWDPATDVDRGGMNLYTYYERCSADYCGLATCNWNWNYGFLLGDLGRVSFVTVSECIATNNWEGGIAVETAFTTDPSVVYAVIDRCTASNNDRKYSDPRGPRYGYDIRYNTAFAGKSALPRLSMCDGKRGYIERYNNNDGESTGYAFWHDNTATGKDINGVTYNAYRVGIADVIPGTSTYTSVYNKTKSDTVAYTSTLTGDAGFTQALQWACSVDRTLSNLKIFIPAVAGDPTGLTALPRTITSNIDVKPGVVIYGQVLEGDYPSRYTSLSFSPSGYGFIVDSDSPFPVDLPGSPPLHVSQLVFILPLNPGTLTPRSAAKYVSPTGSAYYGPITFY